MTVTGLSRDATADHAPSRWRNLGLGPRLFAAVGLVVLAGGATLLTVALLVAPQLFHDHLQTALGQVPADTQRHVDQAFTSAVLLSLGVAVGVAVIAALTITWLVARRIAAPVADLAAAADRLAAGHHAHVVDPALGPEFTALAHAFNTTADRLSATEQVRQRMLADLAHELRTPLASVEATVEAVADGVLAADQTTWTTLTDQTRRLSRLVDDIAAVSHAEERSLSPDLHTRALSELATIAAAAVHARYTAKGVTLTMHASQDDPRVRVDPQRLGEALTNLLDNALRHTRPGATVTITTGRTSELGQDMARITVADTGDGFPPAEADRLFERFYRTDHARTHHDGGAGIGLTITKAIVNAHSGTIRAHSDGPGRGARFDITLPLAPGSQAP